MIYHERQPEFEIWEEDWDGYEYLVGFCYGWDDAFHYRRCGYIVERV